jgi:hypothetical protein
VASLSRRCAPSTGRASVNIACGRIATVSDFTGALLVGGWSVYAGQLEGGGVDAFISGIGRITDP